MVNENGMVMMTEAEFNSRLSANKAQIQELEKRCEMLQAAILRLASTSSDDKADVLVPKLDFLKIYNLALEEMFEHPERDANDIYGHDITIHWHGMYCNCCDGALPANYIIPALEELCEEDPTEY